MLAGERANIERKGSLEQSRRTFLRVALGLGGAAAFDVVTGCSNNADGSKEASSRPEKNFSPTSSWEQDFTAMKDGALDSTVWTYDTDPNIPGYNQEEQAYTKSEKNARIENGHLVIEAHREPYTYLDDPDHHYQITSARINTRMSLTFEYGKIEASLKFSQKKGTWSAFWMLSANNSYTNNTDWDKSDERFYMHDGELDIVEIYGNLPGQIEATVHTYDKSQEKQMAIKDATDNFHTYGVEVTPADITWTLDGTPYYQVIKTSGNPDKWPFGNGNRLYAILNLAMGGSGGEIDRDDTTWRMEAENIRYYEYTGKQ